MSASAEEQKAKRSRIQNVSQIATLFLVLAIVVGIRVRLLNLPLERDEGEYAYGGQVLLRGLPLYDNVYTMKFPGTHTAYAVIMAVFGQTPAGIRAGLILINLLTAALVFVLTRRICGAFGGIIAAASYALFSISLSTLGLAAHATHFVMLPALAGIVLIQNLGERTRSVAIFSAGALFSLAILMKQSGAAFLLFAVAWIAWKAFAEQERKISRLFSQLLFLSLGVALPFLLIGVAIFATGTFDRFWLWTIQYSREYASILSPGRGLQMLLLGGVDVFRGAPALWLLAGAGLLLLFLDSTLKRCRFFLATLLVFSFVAVSAGLYFRGHYFLLLIPTAAVFVGIAASGAPRLLEKSAFQFPPAILALLIFWGAALQMLLASRDVFFVLSPRYVSLTLYNTNPFPEAQKIGDYLRARCPPNARVAVIGSEPEIYFYSRRRSATGYIYMYPLMEPQPFAEAMQREMIREIESNAPEYVVFINVSSSWLARTASNPLVFDWFDKYQRAHLVQIGLVQILSAEETEYNWSVEDQAEKPRSDFWLAVYRKRAEHTSAPSSSTSFQPDEHAR